MKKNLAVGRESAPTTAASRVRPPASVPLPYGTKLRDNDPRMNGRVVTLTGSRDKPRVYAMDRNGRYFKISRARIHTDGKPRRSGFSVVSAPEARAEDQPPAGRSGDYSEGKS